MSKINVLSFEIANLIAAGEVVERPSSVMKELLENAIDSGATAIVAEIKHGGVSSIRVTDNGCGMDREDLPVALKRHATSKIREKDDLNTIMTLGFRGEALAAIAAVSELTIISKTADAAAATMLSSEGGQVVDISEVLAADGTTVVVNNLFYNVPARRKFLKKDATEAMNVSVLVEKVAISRPDISIQLLIDGNEKFKTPGDGVLMNTVYAIFGREFSSKLIEVDSEADGIHVHGFVGRSDNVRKNRNLMNVFINGRYVKSLTAQAAIERAYTSYIAPEAFPTCVLFIDMNPLYVDVNVHPAKLEVKFADERAVFEIVYYSVKTALEKHEYRPEISLGKNKPERNYSSAFVPIGADTSGEQLTLNKNTVGSSDHELHTASARYTSPDAATHVQSKVDRLDRPMRMSAISSSDSPVSTGSNTEISPSESVELLRRYKETEERIIASPAKIGVSSVTDTEHDRPVYRYVGEIYECYLIVEYEGNVILIDKHAAHERILFENLKKQQEENQMVDSQILILPLSVSLNDEALEIAKNYKDEFKSVGFDYRISTSSCELLSVPTAISTDDSETLLVKMIDEIIEGIGRPSVTNSVRREKALYQIACKAAIKAGRIYTREVIDWLISRVLSLPDITVCPHGRPIAYMLTKSELDRQFERLK